MTLDFAFLWVKTNNKCGCKCSQNQGFQLNNPLKTPETQKV